jgi:hypothetical protein
MSLLFSPPQFKLSRPYWGWNKSCSQTHANAVRSKNVGRQTDRKTLQWLNTTRILVCKPSFRAEQRMENGHAPQSDVRERGELSG